MPSPPWVASLDRLLVSPELAAWVDGADDPARVLQALRALDAA